MAFLVAKLLIGNGGCMLGQRADITEWALLAPDSAFRGSLLLIRNAANVWSPCIGGEGSSR